MKKNTVSLCQGYNSFDSFPFCANHTAATFLFLPLSMHHIATITMGNISTMALYILKELGGIKAEQKTVTHHWLPGKCSCKF